MIKLQYMTPEVYYTRSRDFQSLGRVYDVVLNYLKTNADTINNAPFSEDIDDTLVDLCSTTLGFKGKHNYNIEQLKALCSIFQYVIKNKGNIQSITTVLNMLSRITNISDQITCVQNTNNSSILEIYVPTELTDLTIFYDILDYILPAGMSCSIRKRVAIKSENNKTELKDSSEFITVNLKTFQTSFVTPYVNNISPAQIAGGRLDSSTINPYIAGSTNRQYYIRLDMNYSDIDITKNIRLIPENATFDRREQIDQNDIISIAYKNGPRVKECPPFLANTYYLKEEDTYTLVNSEPSDWSTKWNTYYIKDTQNIYKLVRGYQYQVTTYSDCGYTIDSDKHLIKVTPSQDQNSIWVINKNILVKQHKVIIY